MKLVKAGTLIRKSENLLHTLATNPVLKTKNSSLQFTLLFFQVCSVLHPSSVTYLHFEFPFQDAHAGGGIRLYLKQNKINPQNNQTNKQKQTNKKSKPEKAIER